MSPKLSRKNFLQRFFLGLGVAFTLPEKTTAISTSEFEETMNPIIRIKPLGFQWETADPFLFCVHHEDHFPKGNDHMGPDPSYFKGRHMGDDFIIKDGFRMYHGRTVPGFPGHPHRGFETITLVRKGLVDHADSMGAAGRYGNGDVQWMTAGRGVQHSEMFPLLNKDKDNPLELFQIWLNLPQKNKMVDPHFKMLWREDIPVLKYRDSQDKNTLVEIIAGKIGTLQAPSPPPNSWASDPTHEVAIWNIKMEAGAIWTLPQASKGINRTIYFYEGTALKINETEIPSYHAVELHADKPTQLIASTPCSILLLQGKPIGEPVIQYGPFVMNTKEEINQAFQDYHATQFGGWPWPRYDQVHGREMQRFARHADRRMEEKSL